MLFRFIIPALCAFTYVLALALLVIVTNSAYLEWLLHADGGIFGTFDRWTSPGLFLTGSLGFVPDGTVVTVWNRSVDPAGSATHRSRARYSPTSRPPWRTR